MHIKTIAFAVAGFALAVLPVTASAANITYLNVWYGGRTGGADVTSYLVNTKPSSCAGKATCRFLCSNRQFTDTDKGQPKTCRVTWACDYAPDQHAIYPEAEKTLITLKCK
jgi:hypothetical protein